MTHAPDGVTVWRWQVAPVYGRTDAAMDEAGYAVGIPPCIWGDNETGLLPPPVVSLDTNITVIKSTRISSPGHPPYSPKCPCRMRRYIPIEPYTTHRTAPHRVA